MERPNPAPKESASIGAGIALIVIGLLVFVPSGLCTGVLIVNELSTASWDSAFVPLIIGGPFVFGGGILLWFGISSS